LLGSENKEVLVVLRNEKGEEHFSKVLVNEQNTITISPDNEHKLDNGTYVVIACSNNKLYSQKVTVK
jgi:ribosome biogenesis protein Tsr3